MDSSQIEADGRQVLGVGIVHMNSFNDIYTLDSQYVVWVLSEPRSGSRLEKFATW